MQHIRMGTFISFFGSLNKLISGLCKLLRRFVIFDLELELFLLFGGNIGFDISR